MTIVFVALYLIFLVIFVVASTFALYQIWQFGYVGDASARVIGGYAMITTIILVITAIAFALLR